MELTAIFAFLPYCLLFLVSGLLINLIQAFCYLVIRPFSKNTFRRINGEITQILWLQILFLMEWNACFQVKLYTDRKTYKLMGKEHAIIMPNHISDADTSIVWLLARRSGCLGSAITVMKKSSKYLPVLLSVLPTPRRISMQSEKHVYGWASWFSDVIFLDRNWTKDEFKLKSSFQELKDFPRPLWLTIFVEGTRHSPDRLLDAQNFATAKGFPAPKNVLVPRTKGFIAAIQKMRPFVPAVYDVTFAVPKGHPLPSTLGFVKGKRTLLKVYIKRYSIKDIPESEVGIAKWCRDRFVDKDAMLEKFLTDGKFDVPEISCIGRSIKSLLVVLLGFCVVFAGAWMLCQKLTQGRAIVGTMLVVSLIMSHVFIEYTKFSPQKSEAVLTRN